MRRRKFFSHHEHGSPGFVVAHARWQRSRGRNPSMPFRGIRNPQAALAAAQSMLSVRRYQTAQPMDNPSIAKRLVVTCSTRYFCGFHRGSVWVGGKADAHTFTVTLNPKFEHLHKAAAQFATCIGES